MQTLDKPIRVYSWHCGTILQSILCMSTLLHVQSSLRLCLFCDYCNCGSTCRQTTISPNFPGFPAEWSACIYESPTMEDWSEWKWIETWSWTNRSNAIYNMTGRSRSAGGDGITRAVYPPICNRPYGVYCPDSLSIWRPLICHSTQGKHTSKINVRQKDGVVKSTVAFII